MTNATFRLLSEEEKSSKFRAVLKSKTDGCLTEEEMWIILKAIPPGKQCCIVVYQDETEFCSVLAMGGYCRSRIVLGQVMTENTDASEILFSTEQTVAVIVGKMKEGEKANQLLIFIPQKRLQKGYQEA